MKIIIGNKLVCL